MRVNGHAAEGFEPPPPERTAQQPVTRPAAAPTPNYQGGFDQQPNATSKFQFRKAVKYAAKGRVALVGPAGSGKSLTMLKLARALAGPTGKIACIDTEHGSLSKYADQFDFDVIELDSFTPENFLEALTAAEDAGYAVFGCDSLSHFWVGKDGALEFVDMAARRHKDQMGGWKDFRPHERAMVDRMTSSSCHIICTMRTKTDYQESTDANGKKKRVKIGLAPVQRDGLEYEFDLVGYMDDENTLVVDKTRCSSYAQKAIPKPGATEFQPFIEWLAGAATPPKPVVLSRPWATKGQMIAVFESLRQQSGQDAYYAVLDKYGAAEASRFESSDLAAMAWRELCALPSRGFQEPQPDTGGNQPGTRAAADFVAQQKIAELSRNEAAPAPSEPESPVMKTMADVKRAFGVIREQIGETRYLEELQLAGVADPSQFRTTAKALECYLRLARIAQLQKKEVA